MPDTDSTKEAENKSKRPRILWISAILSTVVIAAGIIIYLVMSGSSQTSEDQWKLGEIESYSYTYEGQNDEWTARYQIDGSGGWTKTDDTLGYDGAYEGVMTLSYRKDLSDLASVHHAVIIYELYQGFGKLDQTYIGTDIRGILTLADGSHEGSFIYIKGDTYSVTLNLDGQEQTLTLAEVT